MKNNSNTSKGKTSYIITGALILSIGILILYHLKNNAVIIEELGVFRKEIYKTERKFIESFPIFDDYTTPKKEKKLRKFLLAAHLGVAKKSGMKPVRDETKIKNLTQQGKLVKLEWTKEKLYYFYNVHEELRYLTPRAAKGLELIADRFQENIREKGELPPVKIAISSALRPMSYQKGLTKKNINATIESTHTYGISFDIFFDDYYISFPEPTTENSVSRELQEKFRTRFGFLIGDSLRRQFHSVLMETLIELQDEQMIYAILERKQHCYHVTVLK